jgi:hypothetical protein
LRHETHHSIPEIHQELSKRGVSIAERTVTNLLARYEELVTLHLTDQARLRERLVRQGHVILVIDGLQPDVGHEVLWVLRDCLSGEVLLQEVQQSLPVPIHGVISDGQHSIRNAVRSI